MLFGPSAHDPPRINAQIQKIVGKIRKAGYPTPAKLLSLLSNVDAFDSFADTIGLKAKQARLLWKGLEDLDVVLTPRGTSDQSPQKGPQSFEIDEKRIATLQHLFQKFSDRTDPATGRPRMSIKALHKSLVDMNVAVCPSPFRRSMFGSFVCIV